MSVRNTHNLDIGNATGHKLPEILKNDMIEKPNGWRSQTKDGKPIDVDPKTGRAKALDTYFLRIIGKYSGIAIFANPTDDQPGNAYVHFKRGNDVVPSKWNELKPFMMNEKEFIENRREFLNSPIKVTYKAISDFNSFRTFSINVLLAFEVARRVEPESGDNVSYDDTKKAIGIVFNLKTYESKSSKSYEHLVSLLW